MVERLHDTQKVAGSIPPRRTRILFSVNIQIIYEDKNFVAVNKPAGLLVHRVQSKTKEATLVDWLLEHYPQIKSVGDDCQIRPGIVHRLDKGTSGVLLVAKNQEYFDYLKKLFQRHEIEKIYLALVWGKVVPKEGIVDKPIGLKPGSVKRTVFINKAKMVKSAITKYKVKEYLLASKAGLPNYSLLEVAPKTGRTHQIRIHLASIGHPVVGDPLYGGKRASDLGRLFLHAYSLEFTPEQGKKIKLVADLPSDLTDYLYSVKLGLR